MSQFNRRAFIALAAVIGETLVWESRTSATSRMDFRRQCEISHQDSGSRDPVSPEALELKMNEETNPSSGLHDFDFLIGRWDVHHRRLKERLAGNREWVEFEGTTVAQRILGDTGNIDDNVLKLPGGTYRAVSLRSFDSKSHQWSIWWLDGRSPQGPLDRPLRGEFRDGVGTFYADDTLNGTPIRVRFIWSNITPNSARWVQAFSADGGQTWESNWTMEFVRAN